MGLQSKLCYEFVQLFFFLPFREVCAVFADEVSQLRHIEIYQLFNAVTSSLEYGGLGVKQVRMFGMMRIYAH